MAISLVALAIPVERPMADPPRLQLAEGARRSAAGPGGNEDSSGVALLAGPAT